jgi:ribosome recycling factor
MSEFITIYRLTTIGKALSDALAELQKDNEIREDLSKKVMEQFDKVVCEKFTTLPQN